MTLRRGEQFAPPLNSDELAFYDAVAQNESAVTGKSADILVLRQMETFAEEWSPEAGR